SGSPPSRGARHRLPAVPPPTRSHDAGAGHRRLGGPGDRRAATAAPRARSERCGPQAFQHGAAPRERREARPQGTAARGPSGGSGPARLGAARPRSGLLGGFHPAPTAPFAPLHLPWSTLLASDIGLPALGMPFDDPNPYRDRPLAAGADARLGHRRSLDRERPLSRIRP